MKKIILDEHSQIRPVINSPGNFSIKELSKKLLDTTYNGYSNTIEPLLILGLAIMARYKKDIQRCTHGFPVTYVHGMTSAGKTSLLDTISFLLGYDEEYAISGDSTVPSMWKKLSECSCVPIIYEEISEKTLNEGLFEGLIKGTFQGMARDKIAKAKMKTNATLILGSNSQPPQKPEILNRLLLCNLEILNFKPDFAIDFDFIRENHLSALLKPLVTQKPSDVLQIFKDQREKIKSICPELKIRCLNNIATAYTGYQILLNLAEEKIPSEVQKSFEKFVQNYNETLNVKSPWYEFVSSLPLLARNNTIVSGRDYKYINETRESMENNRHKIIETPYLLYIHFEKAYQAFSAYYRQISKTTPPQSRDILNYAKSDEKVIAGKEQITQSQYIGKAKKRCLVLDIRDNQELWELDKM